MAQSVIQLQATLAVSAPVIFRALRRTLFLSLVMTSSSFVYAENFIDPTRPPAAMETGRAESGFEKEPGLRLQSVLIAPNRRVATINGHTFHVGDKVGDAQVDKILESEVILKTGKVLQSLRLFPDVNKKSPVTQVAKKINTHSHIVKEK